MHNSKSFCRYFLHIYSFSFILVPYFLNIWFSPVFTDRIIKKGKYETVKDLILQPGGGNMYDDNYEKGD